MWTRQTNHKNGETICKEARVLDIGDNILIHIPVLDKRSPFDPPNLEVSLPILLKVGTRRLQQHQERLTGGI